MRALDKKLFRDLLRLWAQELAIALVMASGVATLTPDMVFPSPAAILQNEAGAIDASAGRTDGVFGPKTAAAISGFQASKGLKATGVASPSFAIGSAINKRPSRGSAWRTARSNASTAASS